MVYSIINYNKSSIMDLESSSIVALLFVNFVVLLTIITYFSFFYKWESKQYDDLGENLDNYKKAELFNDGPSNIESLLGKDESSVLYSQSTIQGQRFLNRNNKALTIDLTSIKSKEGGFRANSISDRSSSQIFL
jgi:hypothetical protein